MKYITINSKQLKIELYIFIACFIAMELVNAYAISAKNGEWSELIMSLGYVGVAAGATYVIIGIIRLIVIAVRRCFMKKRR